MVRQHVAVAFMDLDNFTHMCEQIPIGLVIDLTAHLFDACSEAIYSHGGVIDKFVGDCVMAVWGAPTPLMLPGKHGAESVHQLLRALKHVPPPCPLPGPGLRLRVGLNC
eukprot:EG_transcript_63518